MEREQLLRTGALAVELNPENGRIRRLILQPGDVVWNSHPGNLVIRDDRVRREYDETFDACEAQVRRTGENELRLTKRFSGSAFTVHETWRAESNAIRWRLELELDRGAEPRSVHIGQRVPWGDNNWGTMCWLAHPDFPVRVSGIVGREIEYGDPNYGAAIPLMTLYRPDTGVGLSVAKPLGLRVPRLRFRIPHWQEAGTEARFSFLRLDVGTKAVVELLFAAHEACWRPALKWFSNLYPEYFDPPNPEVRRLEGGYLMSSPGDPVEHLAAAKDHGVKWTEVHNHFPCYGNYVPDEKEWPNNLTIEDPKRPEAITVSPDLIRQHCRNSLEHGIAPLLYFQCAGDGYIPYVEKQFPDSVAITPAGRRMPVWIRCWLMNSDESTDFGKHIRRQIGQLFVKYPEIGGIFLDQLCYGGVDAAHDDGVTMVDNHPAYKLEFCYDDTVKRLSEEVHARGKLIIANGPYNVEVQRYVDGHMAEGSSRMTDLFKYLCIRKPLLFLSYYKTVGEAERMFQTCLRVGASYSMSPEFSGPEIEALCRAYLPLIDRLMGRRWLLEPDPLTLPAGNDGNIFIGEDGTVLVTVVRTSRSLFDAVAPACPVKVKVSFGAAGNVSSVMVMSAEYKGEKPVPFERNGNTVTVDLPAHGVASLVLMKGAKA